MYTILKRLESHDLIKSKWDYIEAHHVIVKITRKDKEKYIKYKISS